MTANRQHRGNPTGWIVAVAVTAMALAAAALWLSRRRTGMDRVVSSWKTIDRALARRGLARPSSSTPVGHIRGLAAGRSGDEAVATLGDMATVATILQDVTYGFVELTPEDVGRATRASRRARRAVLSGALASPVEPGLVAEHASGGEANDPSGGEGMATSRGSRP